MAQIFGQNPLEPEGRIELPTSFLPRKRSTTELLWHLINYDGIKIFFKVFNFINGGCGRTRTCEAQKATDLQSVAIAAMRRTR